MRLTVIILIILLEFNWVLFLVTHSLYCFPFVLCEVESLMQRYKTEKHSKEHCNSIMFMVKQDSQVISRPPN